MFLEEAILLICCLKMVKSCHVVGANPLICCSEHQLKLVLLTDQLKLLLRALLSPVWVPCAPRPPLG